MHMCPCIRWEALPRFPKQILRILDVQCAAEVYTYPVVHPGLFQDPDVNGFYEASFT